MVYTCPVTDCPVPSFPATSNTLLVAGLSRPMEPSPVPVLTTTVKTVAFPTVGETEVMEAPVTPAGTTVKSALVTVVAWTDSLNVTV